MNERSYLSIGEVLDLLVAEFPDVTISKIRFLESRGLIDPQRTPSGYRKFYDSDVERLGWILRQQREHFLPLKVIKGRLEAASGQTGGSDLVEPSLFDDDCTAPPVPAGALVGVAAQAGAFSAREQQTGSAPSRPSRSSGPAPVGADVARRSTPRSSAPVGLALGAGVEVGALGNSTRSLTESHVNRGESSRSWAGRERPTSWPVVQAPAQPEDHASDQPIGPSSDVPAPRPILDPRPQQGAPDKPVISSAPRNARAGRAAENSTTATGDTTRPPHELSGSEASSPRQTPADQSTGIGSRPEPAADEAAATAGIVPTGRRSSSRRRQGASPAAAAAAAVEPHGVEPRSPAPKHRSPVAPTVATPAAPPDQATPRRATPAPDSRASGSPGSLARGMHLSGDELAAAAAVDGALVAELEEYGLLAGRMIAGVRCYDEEAVVVARLAGRFRAYGIESRHLRTFKHAAEREAGLFSQVVTPLLRQRNPAARERATASLTDLSELGAALQAALVRGELRDLTGG